MIKVLDLVKRRDSVEILKGITLEVEKGDVAVVIGPSGSGKTTFLRCLNGLERLDGGSVMMNGTTLRAGISPREEEAALKQIRAHVGMVFQQFNLFPHMSVLQNIVEAPIRVARRPKRAAVEMAESLLARVGLSRKSTEMPGRLSGGEQQRVAIARALAMEPEVLLFDEPTSALDPKMTEEVLSVMADLAAAGQTMVVVTHAMSFARRAANKVHVFHDGALLESGSPEQVFGNPREAITRDFLKEALTTWDEAKNGKRSQH